MDTIIYILILRAINDENNKIIYKNKIIIYRNLHKINNIFLQYIMIEQKRIFLTFGGPTYNYRNRSKIVTEQAKKCNWFTDCIGLNDDFLRLSPFFATSHMEFLETNQRGYGFWLWKPYIIKTFLDKLREGDVLVYADAGCTNNPTGSPRFNEYLNILDTNEDNYGIISFQLNLSEIKYSKRLLLETIDATEHMATSGQCIATSIIIKKNSHSTAVIDKWWELAEKYDLINDVRMPHENLQFIDHRHDQSIFSVLVKKYGSIKIPDETFFYPDWIKGYDYPIWATRHRN